MKRLALRCRLAARRINGESRRNSASGLGGIKPLDQLFALGSAPAGGTGGHPVAAREASLLPAACRLPFAPGVRRRTERCRRRGSYCRGATDSGGARGSCQLELLLEAEAAKPKTKE